MSFSELRVQDAAALLRAEADRIIRSVRGNQVTLDEFDRAVESVVCNIAEGRGRRSPREQAHFYSMARGSSDEARSCVKTLVRRGAITWKEAFRPIGLTYSIGKMLTALINRALSEA
jgi:four helix bundle protein